MRAFTLWTMLAAVLAFTMGSENSMAMVIPIQQQQQASSQHATSFYRRTNIQEDNITNPVEIKGRSIESDNDQNTSKPQFEIIDNAVYAEPVNPFYGMEVTENEYEIRAVKPWKPGNNDDPVSYHYWVFAPDNDAPEPEDADKLAADKIAQVINNAAIDEADVRAQEKILAQINSAMIFD